MTNREWVLVILLLSLLQAFIWYAAFVNAGNGSALNYVSFAGTLISIILAVLAIGYTYGESVSEKSKGDTLAAQISSLSEVTRGIKIQAESLDKVAEIKAELSEIASRMEGGLQDTQEKVSGMSGHLESVARKMDGLIQEKIGGINKSNVDKDDAIQSIMAVRNPLTEVGILLILVLSKINKTRSFENVRGVVEKYLIKTNPKIAKDKSVTFAFIGCVFSLICVLEGFGLILVEKDSIKIDDSLLKSVKDNIYKNSICVDDFSLSFRDALLSDIDLPL